LLNESKLYFEKGISENPLVPHNYIGMGLLNLKSKNLDLSLKYFNTSLQLLDRPFYEHYKYSYRMLFEDHKIFYKAEIHAAMAQAYSEKGLEDEALSEKKIALSICPCAERVLYADLN
jgi:tetratricopeptide (TPR) repeat protein